MNAGTNIIKNPTQFSDAYMIFNVYLHIYACIYIHYCSRVIDQMDKNGVYEVLDKHRFLVLTKEIDDEDYIRITNCSNEERHSEVSKVYKCMQYLD